MNITLTKAEHSKLRRIRLAESKLLGTHTKIEWEQMLVFFERTCACCLGESDLLNVEKDHIIPIYKGGSDHIRNIQPLCAKCNSSKGRHESDCRQKLANFLGKQLPDLYKNPY